MSLVQELQGDAFDPTVSHLDLLRKAKVVARKLGVQEFSEWIELEIAGYPAGQPIPPYRQVRGEIISFNPTMGALPVNIDSEPLADAITRFPFHDSISKIQNLIQSTEGNPSARISRELPEEIVSVLRPLMTSTASDPLYFGTTSTQLSEILDSVRNAILEWSLKLEEDGIVGEGISFSKEEKQMAASHFNNYGAIIGTMNESQLQQNTKNSEQNYQAGASLADLGQFVRELGAWLQNAPLSKDEKEEIKADLITVESQIASPKPKNAIIRAGLESIKSVLEKVAVNALEAGTADIGQTAQDWIGTLTSHLASSMH
jgi:hypothetical protein